MSAEALNSITPGDIYTVSREVKDLLNRLFGGNLSSVAFIRENKEGLFEIKPATHSDKKMLEKIFQDLKNYK